MTSQQQRDALTELSRFVVSDANMEELMQRIAQGAKELIPAAADVSISFSRGANDGWAAAVTGELATVLDEAQYELQHGPCIDAASGGEILLIHDFRTEDRWPDYTPRAVEAGAGSSLSIPLPVQQHVIAALNIYSREVDAFSDDDIGLGCEIAGVGAVAITNAALYESASQLAANLQEAMKSRAVIEQAKGILMATSRCPADDAFNLLVKASQRENRKLRDIAADIVARYTDPEGGGTEPAPG